MYIVHLSSLQVLENVLNSYWHKIFCTICVNKDEFLFIKTIAVIEEDALYLTWLCLSGVCMYNDCVNQIPCLILCFGVPIYTPCLYMYITMQPSYIYM